MVFNSGTTKSVKREYITIDDTEDITTKTGLLSVKEEEDEVIPEFDLIDLTDDDGLDGPDFIREVTPRFAERASLTLPFGHSPVDTVQTELGATLTPGVCVELIDGDFLRIKCMVRRRTTREVTLKGILFRRTRRVDDMLPKKHNEVCMMLRADTRDSTSPRIDNCLVSVPLASVSVMRELICTNLPFPALSFRESERSYHRYDAFGQIELDYDAIAETAVLVCRWKYVESYDGARMKVVEQMLTRLGEAECDPYKSMANVQLAQTWRGVQHERLAKNARRQGNSVDLTEAADKSSIVRKGDEVHIDLTLEDDENGGDEYEEEVVETSIFQKLRRTSRDGVTERQFRSNSIITERRTLASASRSGTASSFFNPINTKTADQPTLNERYIYGDICAGAGGVASGAEQSGLKLRFLLDHWDDACATLRANFSATGTKILNMSIFDFCTGVLSRRYFRVDILHISFPCQPHSPAHTREGKNDDDNTACGYSAIPILKKCRPRIATFEQTSGIITHRGGWHFRALIHQLTEIGYSARWKIVNMAEYGNVQARKRLIIIAAGPGEILPPFPAPTHGTSRQLTPFITIRDVLARVPRSIPEHMRQHTVKPHGVPYNATEPLKQAITTSGGESNLHPNGKRSFNMGELALCQSFLPKHKFVGCMTSIRRQIGNAVPSCFAKTLFEEITKSLRESDRKSADWKPEVIQVD